MNINDYTLTYAQPVTKSYNIDSYDNDKEVNLSEYKRLCEDLVAQVQTLERMIDADSARIARLERSI